MAAATVIQKGSNEPLNQACLEAIWEVEGLVRKLPSLLPDNDPHEVYAARCVIARIAKLANALAWVLDGESITTAEQMNKHLVN